MTRPIDRPDATSGADHQGPSLFKLDIADVIGIVRRGWLKILSGTVLGLLASLAYVASQDPTYKASVRMVIERSATKYMQNKLADGPAFDDADTWSQILIISSESIVLPVVKYLDLANDAEFVGPPKSDSSSLRALSFGGRIRALVDFRPVVPTQLTDPERVAYEAVLRRLSVYREDGPYVINITFESRNPKTAAKVANAIADTYLSAAINSKFSITKTANVKMQERLTELKAQAAVSERTLLEYKMANSLTGSFAGSKDKTMSSEQLNSLNTRLADARIAMAESKARLERLEQVNDTETKDGFVPDNDLISKLRVQQLDLAARATDIETRVGKNHDAVLKIQKRIKEVRAAIASEQKRMTGSFTKDYLLAQARYGELTSTVTQVLGEESSSSQSHARMRELESAAETHRTLYNSMLQRFSESARMEAQPSALPDARVVSHAAVPLRPETSKKRIALVAGGSLLGLLLGAALVFAKDSPFGVFRTPQQVKDVTGIYCATLPELKLKSAREKGDIDHYVLTMPFTRFSESIRTIGALVKSAQSRDGSKVFCIASSTPREGRTVVATNLAWLMSASAGTRTLLIDTDFHRQTLTQRMAPEAIHGLREALDRPTHLADFVVRAEGTGLDILPCPAVERVSNASDLLGSSSMQKLIETARASYDVVIIEVAPVAAVVDFRMIAPFCDGLIFVVEWGKTSQRVVLESLAEAAMLWERALCVVLNKADPRALKSIENYKGATCREYYDYETSAKKAGGSRNAAAT